MSSILNRSSFLRTSREFPQDIENLTRESNKAYIEVASAVNERTIGLFPTSRPVVNGESWFLQGNEKQQGLRQIFKISSLASFNHNINWSSIQFITKLYGIGFDSTNYYPIPFVNSSNAPAGQIELYISPTQIVILAGASAPVLASGIIVVEWISNI